MSSVVQDGNSGPPTRGKKLAMAAGVCGSGISTCASVAVVVYFPVLLGAVTVLLTGLMLMATVYIVFK